MNKLNRVMKRLGAGGTAAVVATGVLLLGVTAVGAKAGVSARTAAATSTTSTPSPTSTSTSTSLPSTASTPTTGEAPLPPLDTPATSPDLDDDGTPDQGRGDLPGVAEPEDPERPTNTVPQMGVPDDSGHHSGSDDSGHDSDDPDSGSPSATIDDANDDHGGDRDRSQDREEDSTDSEAASGHSGSDSGRENSGSDD